MTRALAALLLLAAAASARADDPAAPAPVPAPAPAPDFRASPSASPSPAASPSTSPSPSPSPSAPAPAPSVRAPDLALHAHAELIAAGIASSTGGHGDRRFELTRGEATAAAVAHLATGELTVEAVRSAAPGSAAGIDGDSILLRVKRASVGARGAPARDLELDASLGLVADPWIAALADFPLRTLGTSAAEDTGLVASSDLGLTAGARYRELARLRVTITNGEGAHQPERNQGKDTSIVATVRAPLGRLGTLELDAYGRDGSIGPASARSHRAGAALVWHHPRGLAAGADVVRAWGIGDRGDLTGWTADVFADLPLRHGVGVTARWDDVVLAAADPAAADPPDRMRVTGGPWLELAGAVRLVAAVQVERAGAGAPIAGVPAATDATRFLLVAQGSFSTRP